MPKKIGKYSVEGSAQRVGEGGVRFCGTASLVWDEADATVNQLIHFWKEFGSASEAERHAIEQVEIRVRDGVL